MKNYALIFALTLAAPVYGAQQTQTSTSAQSQPAQTGTTATPSTSTQSTPLSAHSTNPALGQPTTGIITVVHIPNGVRRATLAYHCYQLQPRHRHY